MILDGFVEYFSLVEYFLVSALVGRAKKCLTEKGRTNTVIDMYIT